MMPKGVTPQPTAYSPTDTPETLSVDIFKKLVNHDRVKLDIKERDKIPNIDGYMELVDSGVPCGKLEVQIKKIPDNHTKFPIPLSLFAYSERATCNPVIFVGVDTANEKAYWFHINNKLLPSPIDTLQQASITINFPSEHVIDGTTTAYMSEWKIIVDSYLRLKKIDENEYGRLMENSNLILGIARDDFVDIQVFLDELNGLLDGKFAIVKQAFYPTAWKLGFAYYSYNKTSVDFSLYPVPYGKNDVLIKEIDERLKTELHNIGVATTGYYMENPLKTRPKNLALEKIEKMVKEIFEAKLLKHTNSDFLVREFVFAFINKFHEQMGLVEKDSYTVSEIEKGFIQYLPFWTFESIKFMIEVKRNRVTSFADALFRRIYFDPDLIGCQIMSEELPEIHRRVKKALEVRAQLPIMPLGNRDLSFRLFYESLAVLKLHSIKEVNRVYLPKDFNRCGKRGGWVYSVYSPDVLEKNLKTFFDNLPEAYNHIIQANFPAMKDELPLFDAVDLEVILFEAKEEIKERKDFPKIGFYGLVSPCKADKTAIFFSKREKAGDFASINLSLFGKEIRIGEKMYKMITARGEGLLDFIYEDTPMLNFIYETLKYKFTGVFENLIKEKEIT